MSKPIVVIVCTPPNRGSLKQHPHLWHLRAGGGAVHSIKNRLPHCGEPALYSALLKAQATFYVLLLLTGKFTPFVTDVIVRLMAPEERLRANAEVSVRGEATNERGSIFIQGAGGCGHHDMLRQSRHVGDAAG